MASITSLKLNDTSFTLGSDGENVEVVDTQGVVGTALEKTNLQSVIDYLCNKVKNELVTDNELTEKLTESLSGYLLKSAIVQAEGTSTDTVPSSNLLKTLLDTIRSDVSELNSGIFSDIKLAVKRVSTNSNTKIKIQYGKNTGTHQFALIYGDSNGNPFLAISNTNGAAVIHAIGGESVKRNEDERSCVVSTQTWSEVWILLDASYVDDIAISLYP